MSDSTIKQLMEITGLDRHSATTILKINNNNLEEAINYHLEGGGGGDDNSSVSENASLADFLPIDNNDKKLNYIDNNDNDDEIRPPIPPIREQLIQPEYDQFNYQQYNNLNLNTRKRRLIPTKFSVCPFRNFAREAEQQEEEFINNNNNGDDGNGSSSSSSNNSIINNYNERINNRLEYNNNQNIQQRGLSTISSSSSSLSKRKCLEDLFRPPSDILYLGTFQSVRNHATNLNRWLIINLQDHHEFQSQILNRDIWSDQNIKNLIISNFILYQISLDNPDGIRFKTFYHVDNLPYVCIIDPRTGENKLTCLTTTPIILYQQFIKFLNDNSYKLDSISSNINNNLQYNQQQKLNNNNNGPSTSTTKNNINQYNDIRKLNDNNNDEIQKKKIINNDKNINNSNDKLIKQQQPLLELSEQDQLNLAIQNSLKEKRCTIISNKYYNTDDDYDDDDNDDNDNGDDNTNDNYSDIDNINNDNSNNKNELNNVNEKQNNKNYQKLFNEIVVKKDDDVNAANNITESYTNYMGKISDQLTKIQIRTPFGDREYFEWPSSTLLRAIILYVEEKYPTITKNTYKLISPYPKQNILELDNQLTLIEAKLYPSVVLYLHPDD